MCGLAAPFTFCQLIGGVKLVAHCSCPAPLQETVICPEPSRAEITAGSATNSNPMVMSELVLLICFIITASTLSPLAGCTLGSTGGSKVAASHERLPIPAALP